MKVVELARRNSASVYSEIRISKMNSELKFFTMFVSFVFHGLAIKDIEIQHQNEYEFNVGSENLR